MGWFAAVLVIVGTFLNARQSWWCWPIWVAGAASWAVFGLWTRQPSIFALNLVMLGFDIYGWRQWRKK